MFSLGFRRFFMVNLPKKRLQLNDTNFVSHTLQSWSLFARFQEVLQRIIFEIIRLTIYNLFQWINQRQKFPLKPIICVMLMDMVFSVNVAHRLVFEFTHNCRNVNDIVDDMVEEWLSFHKCHGWATKIFRSEALKQPFDRMEFKFTQSFWI